MEYQIVNHFLQRFCGIVAAPDVEEEVALLSFPPYSRFPSCRRCKARANSDNGNRKKGGGGRGHTRIVTEK
jgi:hypothetical protein